MESHSPTRLLMIDDDEKLCRLVRSYLEPFGYSLDTAHNGPDGLRQALAEPYQSIILDVMLPGMGGFEVLQALRKKSNIPVLMLTALGDETDRIAGLESGADDYLPKTFSTRELLARLRAVLRRSALSSAVASSKGEPIITNGGLVIDPESHKVLLDGNLLALTPAEYDILLCLARGLGRVKTREQLLLEVADRDFESFDRAIDVHISSLRRKLNEDLKSPRFIETVRGAGYRMRRPGDEPWQ
jgi:DNA-binding response OmpR family regulator